MNKDGVLDGDYLIIDTDKEVQSGDNALLLLYNEFNSTKKMSFDEDNVQLEGES